MSGSIFVIASADKAWVLPLSCSKATTSKLGPVALPEVDRFAAFRDQIFFRCFFIGGVDLLESSRCASFLRQAASQSAFSAIPLKRMLDLDLMLMR